MSVSTTLPNPVPAQRQAMAHGLTSRLTHHPTRHLVFCVVFGLGLLGSGAPAFGQALSVASPESVGLSSERLADVTEALQAHVDAGDIAGVVAAVVRHGRLVYMEALGQADIEANRPMPEDALFRLYSMARSITSLGAMILWEEGAFQLDDPISRYLPQFADQRVFADASSPSMDRTKPRSGEITVEHLLLHTSGMGSRSSSIYRSEGVRSRSITLEQMVDNAARTPLFEDPGTNWRYGISTTILGRLVEVWSGMPLQDFLQERVYEPLGMTDTAIRVGTLLPAGGSVAEMGATIEKVLRAFFDQVNQEGGIYGREINFVSRALPTQPAAAVDDLRGWLEEENPFVLVGTFTPGLELEVQRVLSEKDVPLIAPLTRSSSFLPAIMLV